MPKVGIAALIIGGIIVVALLGFYFLGRSGTAPNDIANDSTLALGDEQSAFMSAFNGTGSVKCTYQDEASSGTAYIKNGKVRVESSGTDGVLHGNVIFKDDTVWAWETNGVEGFMIANISSYQAADQGLPEGYDLEPREIANKFEQNEPECSGEDIQDSIFEPPANVNFRNFEELMNGGMMDNGLRNGIPSEEEIDKMMEQYGGQQ